MNAAPFTYYAAASIDEAVSLLGTHGADARLLAGGQSLVPAMTARQARPAHVIDINRMARAERPTVVAGRVRIPPLMRHVDFVPGAIPGPLGVLLAELGAAIPGLPVRLRGTFCGSLAQADPAAEWCLAAIVLGAEMMARSTARGARIIPAAAFFDTILCTALEDDEMLVEVQIPLLSEDHAHGFAQVRPRSQSFALASALVVYERDEDEMAQLRVGIGGVEAVPRRLPEVEALLNARVPSKRLFREAGELAAEMVRPDGENAAEAAWKADLAGTVVTRALERAAR